MTFRDKETKQIYEVQTQCIIDRFKANTKEYELVEEKKPEVKPQEPKTTENK